MPAKAVTAFNHFASRLRSAPLGGHDVAIRMRGDYTTFHDALTGASYRIFEEATANTEGPFLNNVSTPSTAGARVGRFPARSHPGRALTLMHELGHLLEGADGNWLLPNDGGDPALSDRNTRTVELTRIGTGEAAARETWEAIEMDGSQNLLGFGTVADGVWQTARFRSPQLMAELAKDHSAAWQGLGVSIHHVAVLGKLLPAL